jgi:lipopolysaccharide/colanic/teichoic acid biosynthesis glycosyltransferase
MYRKYIKRLLDFVFALLALLLLSPFLLIITLWLHFANKGAGAFFSQERPGKDEKIFRLYKFKSMTDERDADGNLLPDAQRLTPIGRFIRKTSIDELPQLWNVLKGDMSFIGPRPLLIRYLPYYTEEERLRHLIRPGLSGWAQVNGRNYLNWDDRLSKDVYYVKEYSFLFDCKILFATLKKVINGKDVSIIPSSTPLDIERQKK